MNSALSLHSQHPQAHVRLISSARRDMTHAYNRTVGLRKLFTDNFFCISFILVIYMSNLSPGPRLKAQLFTQLSWYKLLKLAQVSCILTTRSCKNSENCKNKTRGEEDLKRRLVMRRLAEFWQWIPNWCKKLFDKLLMLQKCTTVLLSPWMFISLQLCRQSLYFLS